MPIITVPDVASALATTTAAISPMFTSLLGVALFGLGVVLGGVFAAWVVRKISSAVGKIAGGRRRGRGRRGRR